MEYLGYVIEEVQRRIELCMRLLDRADEKDALTHGAKHNYLAVVIDQLGLCLREINLRKPTRLSDDEPNSIPF